jgi:cation diffusion facilitator family transporter
MDLASRQRRSLRAVDVGLVANVLLAGLKTSVGVIGRSPALFADGINSLSDVVYYVVVRVFTVLGHKPPDKEHPYGHERMESIASVVVGAFVLATGVGVLLDGAQRVLRLRSGELSYEGATAIALWVALFTVASKLVLWVWTRRVGHATGNPALGALTSDHRNDIIAAAAAAIGIALGRAGYPWVDPTAAALVGVVIALTGVGILRTSSADLMGGQPARELATRVRAWLLGVDGVRTVELVRAHSFGPYIVLNVTIGVDGSLTVTEGDAIADEVERVLHQQLEFLRAVHVHYHPSHHREDIDARHPPNDV